MFEGLRDWRSNRDQEAQDAAIATAANLLARRHTRQAGLPLETAGRSAETGSAKPKATVATQLGMVARNASSVYGPVKPEGPGNREATNKSDAGQTLTVGAGIQLTGEITNCQTLIVEGHVEGSAKSGVLQIADGGAFAGEAEIDIVVVSGKFDGTLTAAERLVIRSSGRVSGTIRYAAIAIEAGGRISGDIQVIEGKAASTAYPADVEPAPADRAPQSGPEDRAEMAS